MSFQTWLNRDQLLPRFKFAFRRFRRGSASTTRWWPAIVAVVAVAPYLAIWRNPQRIGLALIFMATLALAVAWLQWVGRERIGSWLASFGVLVISWGGWLFLWLFIEQSWYRVLCVVAIAWLSWWYLDEWRRRQQLIGLGADTLQGTPALVLGFIATFGLGVGAESLIVFLNTPLWKLAVAIYLPIVLCFAATMVLSGWSLIKQAQALLLAVVVLGQVFVLVTWWPTSVYVAGFVLSATYLALVLVLRQEVQGFISRRSFIRELAVLGGLTALVLASARWY